jgi:ABC-type transport system involved in cytochrome bd biosynthesis fused ATPase/permease subunit
VVRTGHGAVARALLTDASVLVFDEPTEGLDPETERQVINGVLDRTAGRTLLLLTHRLAGLDRMDEVVTLDAGQIIERGRFQALAL